jgi:hypothetical protein
VCVSVFGQLNLETMTMCIAVLRVCLTKKKSRDYKRKNEHDSTTFFKRKIVQMRPIQRGKNVMDVQQRPFFLFICVRSTCVWPIRPEEIEKICFFFNFPPRNLKIFY